MNLAIQHQPDSTEETFEKFPVTLTATYRKKTPQVVGVITAGVLTRNYVIPRRDQRNKTGYQRDVSTSRVNKLSSDLELGRVDLPTAVLLNLREYDPEVHLVAENGQCYFSPNDSLLYVVDGQHRIVALHKLMNKDPERWSSFEIPFGCMLGASDREELEQFYVVNSTAKSVRTDLAFDLLKQRAETDPEVMKGLLESGQSWKVEGQALAEALAQTEIWRNRIRFPGEARGATTINNSGMVNTLKPLLATPYFGAVQRPNQVKILDTYWRGIRDVLPEVFHDPTDYTLQKVTGVQVMHLVLVPVIEYIRSTGRSVLESESYADVLREPLLTLQEETASGDIVQGAEFWKAGPDGAAGSFSSNAGRRVLTARIKVMLPEPEIA